MKIRCKRVLALILWLCLSASGCAPSDSEILQPYDFGKDLNFNSIEKKLYRAPGIAGELCVVGDESIFSAKDINASAAVLFNITRKETVYSKNAYVQFPIASLTKLMTALLAFKYGDLDQTVTLTDDVVITTYDAWLCGFKPDDEVVLRDLLKATLVYSGNDAAAAVAVAVGGTLESFVAMMNSEAKELGATSTRFANPHGLDQSGNYSTVYDLYLIFNECLKYPEFREIVRMDYFNCTYTNADGDEVTKKFTSGNGYLNLTAVPPAGISVRGGKTGNTALAGFCLATLAEDSAEDEYIAIILGTESKQQVYAQTNLMLEKIMND